MKALIPIKQTIDYNIKPRIKPDGSGVDAAGVKLSMNPFDEIAVEEAVQLKEQGVVGEIVVVSIGVKKCEDVIRTALAMGADSGVLVETGEELQPLGVAKLLAKIAREQKPDVVLMGKQAIDNDSNQTGQMLSSLLDWPQATFASKIEISEVRGEKSEMRCEVVREVDGGLMSIEVDLPAVITTDLRLNEPRYVQLPDIMKARSKTLDVKKPEDYGVDIKPRLKTLKVEEPAKRPKGKIVDNVDELVTELKKKGVV